MELTVSIAQMKVAQGNPEENLRKAEALVSEANRRGSDLICFPELWTTGLNWKAGEPLMREHEKIIKRIGELAIRYRLWINGSVVANNEEGRPSNTSILFDPEGVPKGVYRKTHLFGLLHEDRHFAAGDALCAVDAAWGLTGLAVCYDIRFPELFRSYALQGVKIVLSPMAFPYPKLHHWKALSRARAIENQLYFVGANQVGSEDLGPDGIVTYLGSSVIVDPWGETVVEASEREEELLTATIDMDRVDELRAKMPVLKDRRPEIYKL